ncbi:TatD family hydrolase [Kingella kingae]|uniref:TatD family hydrolase n=1 Tax=Kingella kingae TaxID=504 RepID=UPI000420A49B|nr:TatD family hydrolase [Kingella kingae]
MFTDTHCHLADPALRCRLPDIFAQAQQSGITGMIVPTAEPNDWAHLSDLLCQSMIRAGAIGIHPWFVQTESAGCLADLAQYLQHNPRLWLGEIGLDFYDKSQPETQSSLQIQLFEAQLDLAQQHQRPIILHNLKATAAIVRSLQRTQFTQGGIAHAFSGSMEEAKLLLRHGFKIGIGTLLLNPHAKKVRQLTSQLALSNILLETDSPFGIKNQINTPANLLAIAQQVAQIRALALPDLAQQCEQNLQTLLPCP